MVEPVFAQIKNNLRAGRFYERRGWISEGHWTFYPELGVADTRFRAEHCPRAPSIGSSRNVARAGGRASGYRRRGSRQTNKALLAFPWVVERLTAAEAPARPG
jgi:hypothetical protein